MSFYPQLDIFGAPSKEGIDVGYISSDRGYVTNVTICEANEYAKSNPGTVFIVKNRDWVKYLSINEVNELEPKDLLPDDWDKCSLNVDPKEVNVSSTGIVTTTSGIRIEGEVDSCVTKVAFYGGGGVGVAANPIVGTDGAVLAVDLIRGGFGYQYPPLASIKDSCGIGAGAVLKAFIDEDIETLHHYDENLDIEEYDLCDDDIPGFGRRWGPDGKDLGPWDPQIYRKEAEKTPYQKAVDAYLKLLAEYKKPWWTTRNSSFLINSGISTTKVKWMDSGKTTKEVHNVRHWMWSGDKDLVNAKFKNNPTPPSTKQNFKEDTFIVYMSGGDNRELQFAFTSEDGTHSFTIRADDYPQNKQIEEKIKVKTNTTYKVVSSSKVGVEQGLLQKSSFGRRGIENDMGEESTSIFSNFVNSADDDDDLQIKTTLGKFSSSVLSKTKINGHDTFDITYRFNDSYAFNADGSLAIGVGGDIALEDSFMNTYAISPVPPSNVKGSDFAKETFGIEWDIDFPTEGEYIFKGLYDGDKNESDFYIDGESISDLDRVGQKLTTFKQRLTKGFHKVKFELKNDLFKKAGFIDPDVTLIDKPYGGKFIKEGKKYYYLVGGNDLVGIDFEFFWDESPQGGQTITKATLETEDEPLVFEIPMLDAEPPASLPPTSFTPNWVPVSKYPYGVYPSSTEVLGGVYHEGVWSIDITSPGNYTVEVIVDDRGKIEWDGQHLGDVPYNITTTFTINNVTAGTHLLTGKVENNLGGGFGNNPGSLSWVLKNPTGQIIRTSRDPFNTKLPTGFRSVTFDIQRNAYDINQIVFEGLNYTAIADASLSRDGGTKSNNQMIQEGVSYKLRGFGSGGRTCFFKVENGGRSIGLDDDGGRSAGYYEGPNMLLTTSEGEFYKSDGQYYFKVRKSNLEEDTGMPGNKYQQTGNILKSGTFKDGKKYRLTFDTQPTAPVPTIGDTGSADVEENQKVVFYDILDKNINSTGGYQLKADANAWLAARNARQLSPGVKKYSYADNLKTITDYKVFNTKDYINKANRKLWKSSEISAYKGFIAKYGVSPFDTSLRLQHEAFAGTHPIIWSNVNFPVSANYSIEIEVDEAVRLRIGDQVDINYRGFSYGGETNTPYEGIWAHGKMKKEYFIKKGTYTITADLEHNPGGKFQIDNFITLGVNIEIPEVVTRQIYDNKSWNENPLGVALTIDAPLPSPPVQIVPKSDGECPPNPMWTTRHPGSKNMWHPVIFQSPWSKFMDAYAISPLPPLRTPGSDGTGVVYSNEWTLQIPYDGTYGLKGSVDNWGRVLIDGAPIANFIDTEKSQIPLVGKNNTLGSPIVKKPPLTRIHLTKGSHTIGVEVENWKNYKSPQTFINRKIFNTQDWQVMGPDKKQYGNVTFTTTSATMFGASFIIKDLFPEKLSKKYGGPSSNPTRTTREVTFQIQRNAYDINHIIFNGLNYTAEGDASLNRDGGRKTNTVTVEEGVAYQLSYYGSGGRTCFFKVENGGEAIGLDDDGGRSAGYYEGPNLLVNASEGEFYQSNGQYYFKVRKSNLEETLDKSEYPQINDKRTVRVEKGRDYEVVFGSISSPGNNTTGNPIEYINLKDATSGYRWINDRRIEFDEDPHYYGRGGWDVNGYLSIDSVSNGSAKFGRDGKSIEVKGNNVKVKLTFGWDDNYGGDGFALDAIKIAGTQWTRKFPPTKGSETHTITLSGGGTTAGNNDANVKLRSNGKNVVQMEDIPGTHAGGGGVGRFFDDIICTASEGEFYDFDGYKCKFRLPLPENVNTKLVKNGVSYNGPKLYNYKHSSYGEYLNKNGVSPDYPKVGGTGNEVTYEWSNVNFDVEGNYEFKFFNDAHASLFLDDEEIIRGNFDFQTGVSAVDESNWKYGVTRNKIVNKGKHTISVRATAITSGAHAGGVDGLFKKKSENYYKGQSDWNADPSALAVGITRKEETFPPEGTPEALERMGKSWYENPLGISLALIPAPCPQRVQGKGVVTRVEVLDPGNSYSPPSPPPIGTSIPYTLALVDLDVVDPGINYTGKEDEIIVDPPDFEPDDTAIKLTPGLPRIGFPTSILPPPIDIPVTPPSEPEPPEDQRERTFFPPPGPPPSREGGDEIIDEGGDKIIVDPPNGSDFDPVFDTYGRIVDVIPRNPGIGFTAWPSIRVPSSTGIGVKLVPRFVPIVDPLYLDLPPEKLIQVTDLVGLKQTGYYDGRPYYGAVFYKDNVKYAGYYETAGKLIPIYDTLQESIDAEITTPPSAIQRQGTDVNSNDPKLDIPDTPEYLV